MGAIGGFNAKMGIGTTATVDQPLDFLNESLVCNENFIDRAGLRGTRDHPIEVTRVGLRRVEGSISLSPTAVELSYLLPWIMGADASGTTYALAETLQSRYVAVDRSDAASGGSDGKVFVYDGVKINRAVLRASQGELLNCSLECVGVDETVGNNGTFPAITLDTTTGPFTFSDCVLSIGGTGYNARDFSLTLDNRIDAERFFNSNTRTAVVAQDREVSVEVNVGYGDAEALYNTGIGGVAVTATFTNGTVSLLISLVKVQFPRRSPSVQGKQEIMLPLVGKAHKSSSTASIVCTLDSTP